MKAAKIFLLAGLTGVSAVNLSFAQTWTQTSAPTTNWYSVTCSADGTKLAAVNKNIPPPWLPTTSPIYFSTNSGETWIPSDNEEIYGHAWTHIDSSADGTVMVVSDVVGTLYVSTDSGRTWAPSGSFNWQNGGWNAMCSSADGSIFAASDYGGPIYISTNSGATWTESSASQNGQNWSSVACSSDGSHIATTTVLDTIYISTDYGATWAASKAPIQIWQSIASSSDGKKLVAAAYNRGFTSDPGSIYTSTNSGMTWTVTSAPSNTWSFVASSADGDILAAAILGGTIYTSTNSGTTWAATDAPSTNWQFVVCSADGTKLYAGFDGGGIWTAQTTPRPSINLSQTNGSLALSWLVPSTNFVLQQSADLSGWTDLTNQPALNFTNLKEEVFLPLSGGNGFYRLKTP